MKKRQIPNSPSEFVTLSDFLDHIPACRSTVNEWIRAGEFPEPLPLPSRRRLWYRTEISAWLKNNGLKPLPSLDAYPQGAERPPYPLTANGQA